MGGYGLYCFPDYSYPQEGEMYDRGGQDSDPQLKQ